MFWPAAPSRCPSRRSQARGPFSYPGAQGSAGLFQYLARFGAYLICICTVYIYIDTHIHNIIYIYIHMHTYGMYHSDETLEFRSTTNKGRDGETPGGCLRFGGGMHQEKRLRRTSERLHGHGSHGRRRWRRRNLGWVELPWQSRVIQDTYHRKTIGKP